MKILYIITKSNWGGAQRHVFDLAISFKKKGHDIVVALGGQGVLKDRLDNEGVQTRTIDSLGRDINLDKDIASLKDIYKIIKSEQPDILHLHSTKAGGLGSFAGRLLGVPTIIYTVHGFAFNEVRPLYQKIALVFFSWLSMMFSTDVITISEKELDQAQKFPFVAKKLRMIYPGISSPEFLSPEAAGNFLQSRTKLSLKDRTIVGTIAELHPNKGLIYAINAVEKIIERFPSLIFFVIGEGVQRKSLESLISEKKLAKNVILAGYIDQASKYLSGFSIFLLPSTKEGTPYTAIEAGYAGLPVIATSVGGVPEIIENMKSGLLILPSKTEDIINSLTFMLEHRDIALQYGRTLQEKVRTKFNIENMMRQTAKLYEEARARQPSRF